MNKISNPAKAGIATTLIALLGAIGALTGQLQPIIEKFAGTEASTSVSSSTGTTINKTVNIDGSAKGGNDTKSNVQVGNLQF
jgi:hypothetical protein